MKKKILQRCLLGFPIGVTIGYFITILMSFGWGDGIYYACVPEFIGAMGNALRAVAVQALLCGLVGSGFSASSVIWEMEKWSLAKQTGIYFILISLIMLPIAYLAYWMEHSLKGFLIYFGIFAAIFVLTWIVQYLIIRRNIRKMNENIQKNRSGSD